MSRMVTEAMVEALLSRFGMADFRKGSRAIGHDGPEKDRWEDYLEVPVDVLGRLEAALSVPAAEQKAEPVRKVKKMARFCAEIAWDTAFAWAIDHGRTDQEAYDAASAVRENVLVHALQDDALSTQAIEARNAVIEECEKVALIFTARQVAGTRRVRSMDRIGGAHDVVDALRALRAAEPRP